MYSLTLVFLPQVRVLLIRVSDYTETVSGEQNTYIDHDVSTAGAVCSTMVSSSEAQQV